MFDGEVEDACVPNVDFTCTQRRSGWITGCPREPTVAPWLLHTTCQALETLRVMIPGPDRCRDSGLFLVATCQGCHLSPS